MKIRLSCTDTRSSDRALRTGPMMFWAMGVGTMPWAVRTNSGSLKVSPQARQGVGHCRLGDADDLPGAGQVGFGVDRIEDDEKVEVDLAQIHCAALLFLDLVRCRKAMRISETYIGDEC